MGKVNNFENEKYVFKWGEKYSTPVVDMWARSVISNAHIMSNDIADYLTYIKNGNFVRAYYGEKTTAQMDIKHGEYFLKKSRIKKTLKDYDKIIDQYNRLFIEYNRYDYGKISDKKLYSLFRRYVSFAEKSYAYFRLTRSEGEKGPTVKIREVLEKYFRDNEIEEVFQTISQSPEIDVIGEERIAWLKILENGWDEKKVRGYLMRFAANFVNMYDKLSILGYLRKRCGADKKRLAKIKKEIHNNAEQKRNLHRKQKSIYKCCNYNNDLVVFSQMLQKFGPYRFKLKYAWAGAELHMLSFFQEIIRRMNVSTADYFDLYLVDDIFNFFETGKTLSEKQLGARKKCILVHIKYKKYRRYFGDAALRIVDSIEKQRNGEDAELKGMVAFGGRASGRVKIVHATDIDKMEKVAKKFRTGDILVTEGTQPAMIVLMKKSAAILAEVGGLTSHASIVSREFRKPCIVGIKNLLNSLHDGDFVEVDADKGTITIFKNKS